MMSTGIIILAVVISVVMLWGMSIEVKKFFDEAIPLKREITKTESFIITTIIFLLVIN